MPRLTMVFSREELVQLNTQVVVEGWDKRLYGSVRRAWLTEFPLQSERQKIANLYKRWYDWYLVKGTPAEHVMNPATLNLTERVVNFFGGV